MIDRLVRNAWPPYLPERFKMLREVNVKDVEEFAHYARRRVPKQINVEIFETEKTYAGNNATPEHTDYYELATKMSFPVNKDGISLVKYLEQYPDSRVKTEQADNYFQEHLQQMDLKAILTAYNRVVRLQSSLNGYGIPIVYTLKTIAGLKELSLEEIQTKREEAIKLGLTPFFI